MITTLPPPRLAGVRSRCPALLCPDVCCYLRLRLLFCPFVVTIGHLLRLGYVTRSDYVDYGYLPVTTPDVGRYGLIPGYSFPVAVVVTCHLPLTFTFGPDTVDFTRWLIALFTFPLPRCWLLPDFGPCVDYGWFRGFPGYLYSCTFVAFPVWLRYVGRTLFTLRSGLQPGTLLIAVTARYVVDPTFTLLRC